VKLVSVLHNIMARKFIRVPAGATAIAVSGLLLAAPPAASAATAVIICESYGSYCIGDGNPSVPLYSQVKEFISGRTFIVKNLSGSYELVFSADTSKCVAASDSGTATVVHPCSGGSGVVWKAQLGPDKKSCIFDNQEFSGKCISGSNNGNQFQLKSKGAAGWFQQFVLSSHVISICGAGKPT
jgi:hypothetical protein